jgi:hypothetical protein
MTVTVARLSVGVITVDLTRSGAEMEIFRGKAAWTHVDVLDVAFAYARAQTARVLVVDDPDTSAWDPAKPLSLELLAHER